MSSPDPTNPKDPVKRFLKWGIAAGSGLCAVLMTYGATHPTAPRTVDDFWQLGLCLIGGGALTSVSKLINKWIDSAD